MMTIRRLINNIYQTRLVILNRWRFFIKPDIKKKLKGRKNG